MYWGARSCRLEYFVPAVFVERFDWTICPGRVFRVFSLDGLSRPCLSNVLIEPLVPAVFVEHLHSVICPGRG